VNFFDIGLLAMVAIFASIGAWRGFVREVMALVTWVLAILIAWIFAPDLTGSFEGISRDPALQQVLSFIVIFIGVFIVGTVVSLVLNRLVLKKEALKVPNILMGGVLGTVRGVVVIVIAFMLAGLTPLPGSDWWRSARLAPYFERLAIQASAYIPRDIARHIRYG
jgi:membrane protein required for colicin V production